MSTKIFLIGMPGSGKSTLGKELASLLNLQFFDLDAEIVRNEGKSISQIFKDDGEGYFRGLEQKLLKNLAQEKKLFVMATGGGAPHNGIDTMLEYGKVIYLDVPIEQLVKRLDKAELAKRPLLDKSNLELVLSNLLSQRQDQYKKASYIVSGSSISAKQLLELIN